MTTLAPVLQAFFTERLMAQRRASSHTITGYRDTLRLLVGFACAKTGNGLGPFDGIEVRSFAAAMRVDLRMAAVFTSRVDCDDDALAAEALRRLLHDGWVVDGRGIQRYFVRPRPQDFLNIVHIAQATVDRERNVDAVGDAPHHLRNNVPSIR